MKTNLIKQPGNQSTNETNPIQQPTNQTYKWSIQEINNLPTSNQPTNKMTTNDEEPIT